MKNSKNFDAKQFLEAKELSLLENMEVRGGQEDKKKEKEVKVKVETN